MGKTKQIPVARRSVIARINRKIRDDDLVLRSARSAQARLDVGDYFLVRRINNGIADADKHVDLEAYARKVGALQDYETIGDD